MEETVPDRKLSAEVVRQNLLNAVVLQAVEDYRMAAQELRRHPRNRAAKRLKRETERFFLSEDFRFYTKVKGEILLNKLMKEAEKEHEEEI